MVDHLIAGRIEQLQANPEQMNQQERIRLWPKAKAIRHGRNGERAYFTTG